VAESGSNGRGDGARPRIPARAARDDTLPAEALRLLIALAAAPYGRPSVEELAALTGLRPSAVVARMGELQRQGYVRLSAGAEGPGYALEAAGVPTAAAAPEPAAPPTLAAPPMRARAIERSAEPSAGRAAEPAAAAPAGEAPARATGSGMRRILKAWRSAERFQFWIRTVLSPEDAETFWSWARDNGSLYQDLARRHAEVRSDADLDALLEETHAILATMSGGDRLAV
jgi:hypothetical protein